MTVISVKAYYDSLRIPKGSPVKEPHWEAPPFDDLSELSSKTLEELVSGGIVVKETFAGLVRCFENGLLVGSSTWVFLNRKKSIDEGHYLQCGEYVATSRVCPSVEGFRNMKGVRLWAIWHPFDNGFTLLDRNPGSKKDVEAVFAHPSQYGLYQFLETSGGKA